ncbi:hypothetical protein GCM10011519_33170 [Marmoricola endophyticus]|uniref:Fenitrothion hydrolase n=1 Tax=Marmoricola endophyticus TaxID=2040280 RepID=A0A917F8I7_9ACTN|nr:hypothetical protein [Marmoricola endophyticus]GGF56635.1 hypothetical protein GCM10011519_33170 [Marmoricola endophyticus]
MTPAVWLPLHGVGGARDLPVPAGLAVAAGVAALAASFVVLALAWRTPRYDARTAGRPLPAGAARVLDSPVTRWVLRAVGLAFAGYVAWPLFAGPDVVTNPVFGVFYVLLWVGIVPASLLIGPAYRLLSPVRTVHRLVVRAAGGHPSRGLLTYPARLGLWPAALGLLAFVWQELVDPSSTLLDSVRLWLVLYAAIMLVGAAVFGDTWFARADPFEVWSELVGRLAPIGRRADGRLVLRSPLAGLEGTPVRAGTVAVLAVMFGSTAFDSFKDQLRWVDLLQAQPLPQTLASTLALVGFCLVVLVTFTAAAAATRVGSSYPRRELPRRLVHAVVPIVVGYLVAHYLTYFVEQGQTTLVQLSDPMVDGSDYLGTGGWTIGYWLSSHPSLLATVKVLAVVVGHVTGAVAAHDRALTLLPRGHRVVGQLAMVVLMMAYTGGGLWLLFAS